MNFSNRPVWLLPAIAAAVSLVAVFAILAARDMGGSPAGAARSGPVRVSGEADIGGPFTLVNHHGETVTEADFRGRPMLIYFGFTYCPDICPMSLQVMGAALDQLPDDMAERVQPVLISVDPERDTPEQLAQYVDSEAFPDNLVGLTGTPAQVRNAADAYRVYYARIESGGMSDYLMDHSSVIYLMDGEGKFVEVFPHGTAPDALAERLQHFLEETAARS
jgi:protein SCO1/2